MNVLEMITTLNTHFSVEQLQREDESADPDACHRLERYFAGNGGYFIDEALTEGFLFANSLYAAWAYTTGDVFYLDDPDEGWKHERLESDVSFRLRNRRSYRP